MENILLKEGKNNKMNFIKIFKIGGAIICYFAFLALISNIRAPIEYNPSGEVILSEKNFVRLSDESKVSNNIEAAEFKGINDTISDGLQSQISIKDSPAFYVSFNIQCSKKDIGRTICVDLCADNYDNSEQEKDIKLDSQKSTINVVLYTGKEHPDSAMLRIFSYGASDYSISDISVQTMTGIPKRIEKYVIIFITLSILYVFGTLALFSKKKRNLRK